jgi:hypothetical protein
MHIQRNINKKGYFDTHEKYTGGRLKGTFELNLHFALPNKNKFLRIYNHIGSIWVEIYEIYEARHGLRIVNRHFCKDKYFMFYVSTVNSVSILIDTKRKTISGNFHGYILTSWNNKLYGNNNLKDHVAKEIRFLKKNNYMRYIEDFTKYRVIWEKKEEKIEKPQNPQKVKLFY